jgi:hypothetical protein
VTNLSTYLGLDVHKETIAVAIADGRSSDVRFYGGINNTPVAIAGMLKSLGGRMANCASCTKLARVGMASIVKSMQPAMSARSSRRRTRRAGPAMTGATRYCWRGSRALVSSHR